MARHVAIIGTACLVLTAAPEAFAQGRNVSVRDRAKALYGAEGVRAGAFLVYPTADANSQYTSNVFAEDSARDSDQVSNLNLGLAVDSNWNTHRLGASAFTASNFYRDFDQQNSTDFGGALNGRLDLSREIYFGVDLAANKRHEAIAESPTGLSLNEPIEYKNSSAGLTYSHALNRVRVSAFGRIGKTDFDDGVLSNGVTLEQDDRDVEVSEVGGRVDYAMTASTALYLSTRQNWRKHDLDTPPGLSRDSDGSEVVGGIRFDLTDLLVGEIGVGRFVQHYDATGVPDTESATLRSSVQWFPDELVSVTLAASRDNGDAGIVGAAGIVRDTVSLNLDYEFRRNVILSFGVANLEDDYVGLDRTDERRSYSASVDYIVSRRWSAFAAASRRTQSSSGAVATVGRDYDIDSFSVGVRWRR